MNEAIESRLLIGLDTLERRLKPWYQKPTHVLTVIGMAGVFFCSVASLIWYASNRESTLTDHDRRIIHLEQQGESLRNEFRTEMRAVESSLGNKIERVSDKIDQVILLRNDERN